jgi:MFS family permease
VESPRRSSRPRRILVAYTVNRLGTWLGTVALMLAVFDETHSAVAVAALLFASQALPAFLVPAVVARVEASTRRRELSGLYLFEALVTAMLAVLLSHFWLPAVLLLAAFDGTAALAASALLRAEVARAARDQAAALPHSASPGDASPEQQAQAAERRANATVNLAFSVTFVLGPVLAGVIAAGAGAPTALWIDVGSFLICGALLIDLHPHVQIAGEASVRARLRAAWSHINEVPTLRRLLLVDVFALVLFEAAAPIEVTFAKVTLNAGDRGFGLLLTAWGLGAVLGSVVFARSPRRSLGAMLSAGACAIGLAYLGFAAAPSLLVACIAALIGGVGNGVELPSLISLVQRLTPHRLHGRLMSAVESLNSLCVAIGLPLGGVLVALSSPRAAFFFIGFGLTLTSIGLLLVSRGSPEPAGERQAHPAAHEPVIVASPAGEVQELLQEGSAGPKRETASQEHLADAPTTLRASNAGEAP